VFVAVGRLRGSRLGPSRHFVSSRRSRYDRLIQPRVFICPDKSIAARSDQQFSLQRIQGGSKSVSPLGLDVGSVTVEESYSH
jgi:hypothetical protein